MDGTAGPRLPDVGRSVRANLCFARAGERTTLLRQHVPYPFHITRPFYLDAPHAGLATLYLQSASGGLYGADDLLLTLDVQDGALAHLTTQAATIVHDCRGLPVRTCIKASVGQCGFLALTPDPLVLFPGADIATATDLRLHAGARAILVDAASLHDPGGAARPFARFHGSLTVRDAANKVRLSDRGGIEGEALAGSAVLGNHGAWATLLALAPAEDLPDPAMLEKLAETAGCICGAGPAPGGLGLAARLAGPDGGTLGHCLDQLWAACAAAMLGFALAPRRK
ncbi:MAG TPA: urease accessory protein UreD [Acetobacteraceae bacterium]|nr:urease accessory protein UreD [Acetobacteraceae bacterium]